ncbi:MAG: SOS response-associated peptidase [Oscillospiraceae bacterium]|nr:SOS response-associated peptidase [Oscillospiraceae bacterium]
MCTRFFIDKSAEEFRAITYLAKRSPLAKKFIAAGSRIYTEGEIRPTNVVPVIAPSPAGKRMVYPMKWGFSDKEHGRIFFNARSETAAQKPSFSEAWVSHRCIIPASFYFEWEHFKSPSGKERTGDKFAIQPRSSSCTWLCGLYRIEEGFPVFVILTREPEGSVKEIHDRMPLILPKEKCSLWIDPRTNPAELLPCALTDMITERQV